MTTNITEEHRRVFEVLISGPQGCCCVFSWFCDGEPAAVAVSPPENNSGEVEYVISPLFVSLTLGMTLQPAFYRRYVRLEERIGHTLSPTRVPFRL